MITHDSVWELNSTLFTEKRANDKLLEEVIEKYGHPKSILTDNGALFSSVRGGISTFSRWCQTEGIKHIRARVFHLETCGKVERLHGTQPSSVRWKD